MDRDILSEDYGYLCLALICGEQTIEKPFLTYLLLILKFTMSPLVVLLLCYLVITPCYLQQYRSYIKHCSKGKKYFDLSV